MEDRLLLHSELVYEVELDARGLQMKNALTALLGPVKVSS